MQSHSSTTNTTHLIIFKVSQLHMKTLRSGSQSKSHTNTHRVCVSLCVCVCLKPTTSTEQPPASFFKTSVSSLGQAVVQKSFSGVSQEGQTQVQGPDQGRKSSLSASLGSAAALLGGAQWMLRWPLREGRSLWGVWVLGVGGGSVG